MAKVLVKLGRWYVYTGVLVCYDKTLTGYTVGLDRSQSLAMVLFDKDPVELPGNDDHSCRA